jgi:hypothetical protein
MECPIDLYTSKKNHPCTPSTTPIPTPYLVVNLNLPSPFEVLLESLDSDLLIVVFL